MNSLKTGSFRDPLGRQHPLPGPLRLRHPRVLRRQGEPQGHQHHDIALQDRGLIRRGDRCHDQGFGKVQGRFSKQWKYFYF